MGGMMQGSGFGLGFGLFGVLFNLAIIIGLVVLVVWAVRRFGSNGQGVSLSQPKGTNAETSPREIVERRYAQGEITREQYQEMLSDLKR